MSNNTDTIERKAFIFNVQKYNMYDGPGIRTNIFFKGCPLRCQWCANPEGLVRKYQVMFRKANCVNCGTCVPGCPQGIHQIDEESHLHYVRRDIDCIGCRQCEEVCPATALAITGEKKTISEILSVIQEDQAFYDMSGGGVTLTGGEVTAQPEAATSLLQACKQSGINTCIETSGYVDTDVFMKMAEYIDLFLFDLKEIDSDKHNEYTGVRNELILHNMAELLNTRHNVKVRMPLLEGMNDSTEEMEERAKFLEPFKDFKNFKGIDLLAYHKLGVGKYDQLDYDYPLEGDPVMSDESLNRIKDVFESHGFKDVSIIKH